MTAELRVALKLLARTRASTQRSLQQLLPWRQHRLTLVILLDLSENINVEYAGPDLRVLVIFQKMALARGKIIKANNEEPDEIEKQISQALLDLEVNSDLKVTSAHTKYMEEMFMDSSHL